MVEEVTKIQKSENEQMDYCGEAITSIAQRLKGVTKICLFLEVLSGLY